MPQFCIQIVWAVRTDTQFTIVVALALVTSVFSILIGIYNALLRKFRQTALQSFVRQTKKRVFFLLCLSFLAFSVEVLIKFSNPADAVGIHRMEIK